MYAAQWPKFGPAYQRPGLPMSTATEVLAVLADVLNTREVYDAPDLPLYDLELLDSLRTVELILALSERFGLEISPAEIDRELLGVSAAHCRGHRAPP